MIKHNKYLLFAAILLAGLALTESCQHDPVFGPGPEGPDPNDTIIVDPPDTTLIDHPCDPDTVYFSQDVLPILASNCAIPGCHDAATAEDDVILTSYNTVMSSDVVDPGDPGDSDMYEHITDSDPDKKMPPPSSGISLSNEQIMIIYDWISQGAQDLSCDEGEDCITDNMSFSTDIFPIIQTHCLGCHSGASPSAGITLTDHSSISALALGGVLESVITHAAGFTPMPYNQPKLPSCKIEKIQSWINAGAPNN